MSTLSMSSSVQLAPVQVYDSHSTLSDSESTVILNGSPYENSAKLFDVFRNTEFDKLKTKPIFNFIFKKISYLKRTERKNFKNFFLRLHNAIVNKKQFQGYYQFYTVSFLDFSVIYSKEKAKDALMTFITMFLARYNNKKLLLKIVYDPITLLKESILTDNLSLFKIAFKNLSFSAFFYTLKHENNKNYGYNYLRIICNNTQKIVRYVVNHVINSDRQNKDHFIETLIRTKFKDFNLYLNLLKRTDTDINTFVYFISRIFPKNLSVMTKLSNISNFEIGYLHLYSFNESLFRDVLKTNIEKVRLDFNLWIRITKIDNCYRKETLRIINLLCKLYPEFKSYIRDNSVQFFNTINSLNIEDISIWSANSFLFDSLDYTNTCFAEKMPKNLELYKSLIDELCGKIGGTLEYGPINILLECLRD
jgi:hypothetical protein